MTASGRAAEHGAAGPPDWQAATEKTCQPIVSPAAWAPAMQMASDIARAKARGAVGMGVASRKLAERAKDNPNFFAPVMRATARPGRCACNATA